MSNAPLNSGPYAPDPFAADHTEPPRGAGCGKLVFGCSLVVAVLLIVLAGALYLIVPGVIAFGVQTDLAKYRDTIEQLPLDLAVRQTLVDDLSRLRLSVDEDNRFGLFQWLTVQNELEKLLGDGRLEPLELTKLRAEIDRMKKIQGIAEK